MSDLVEIAGRHYPVCALICPPVEGEEFDDLWDLSLGGSPGERDRNWYIPAENGLLFGVTRHDSGPLLELWLLSTTCELVNDYPDDNIYLPMAVSLIDGALVATPRPPGRMLVGGGGTSFWVGAEPEWVAETIDRLSRLPFRPPPGPLATLIARSSVPHRPERTP